MIEGLTQRAAARLLGVSVSFLRASSCPRVEVPGNGPKKQPLIRYFREDVLAWAGRRRTLQEAPHSATALNQRKNEVVGNSLESLRESLVESPHEDPGERP